jgi:hypothetical protein
MRMPGWARLALLAHRLVAAICLWYARAVMQTSLPSLQILAIETLILHEEHDSQRALPLVEQLRAQGILRNPPIVMPLSDKSGRFLVLDGANRVTALKEMEFPHIVAQLVPAGDPHVGLHPWNHVVWGMSSRSLLSNVRKVQGLDLQRLDTRRSVAAPRHEPVQIRLPDGSAFIGTTPEQLPARTRVLREIVAAYKHSASLDRTSQTLIESVKDFYPGLTALILFPRFELATLLTLAGRGTLLPPGITRFTASPRALHLNYPLHELSSGRSIAYKAAYLRKWVEERVANKAVRMYVETTYLFDE